MAVRRMQGSFLPELGEAAAGEGLERQKHPEGSAGAP